MATTARKVTVAIAVLCLLAGSVFFFQTAPSFPPDTTLAPPPKNPPAIRSNPDETTAPASADTFSSPSVIPAKHQAPALILPASAFSQATVEISLPSPPSGDFELNLTAEQISALVETRYGRLFQTVGLPPEQLARLRSLLAERQQATIDAANAALLVGVNPGRELPTIQNAIEPVQEAIDTALRNELGESVFAAYRDFDRTLGEHNSVGDFARLLATTSQPLRPEQEKQVVQILKNSPGRDVPADFDRAIFGGINARARISEQALSEAATVLSSAQLELLRQLQQHWAAEDARRWPNEKRSP